MKKIKISNENIEQAYTASAILVEKFGEVYLPIFERMHEEIEKHNLLRSKKILALEIARLNKSQSKQ